MKEFIDKLIADGLLDAETKLEMMKNYEEIYANAIATNACSGAQLKARLVDLKVIQDGIGKIKEGVE